MIAAQDSGQWVVTVLMTPAACSNSISLRNWLSPTSAQGEAIAGIAVRADVKSSPRTSMPT
jgi:hypothetical protein